MNSKAHLYISIFKSALRIAGCGFALYTQNTLSLVIPFLIAELCGIVEELFDKR
jgi:hypothetical protein